MNQTLTIKRIPLQRFDVTGSAQGIVIGIAEIAPNVSTGRHPHPGPESGYRIEGEQPRILTTGRHVPGDSKHGPRRETRDWQRESHRYVCRGEGQADRFRCPIREYGEHDGRRRVCGTPIAIQREAKQGHGTITRTIRSRGTVGRLPRFGSPPAIIPRIMIVEIYCCFETFRPPLKDVETKFICNYLGLLRR